MAEEKNWQKELEGTDLYAIASKIGMDVSAYKADSEESMKASLDTLKAALKKRQQENDEEHNAADRKALEDTPNLQKQYDDIKKESEPKTDERETMTVNGQEENALENSWIAAKRAFWTAYATDNAMRYFEDDPADTTKTSLEFALALGEKLQGKIHYSAPNNVQISNDSSLAMYQGLVKDAVTSNLSITAGASLDEKQKLMLYAAVLTSTDTYANGDKPQLLNPPVIDMNNEAFKALPQEVQAVLKAEAERLAQEAQTKENATKEKTAEELAAEAKAKEIQERLQSVKDRLAQNGGDAWSKLSDEEKNERLALRQEQLTVMHEALTPEQIAARKVKEEDREKVMAARLGIIPEYRTKNKAGAERVVTKDDSLIADKKRVPDEIRRALTEKYASRE